MKFPLHGDIKIIFKHRGITDKTLFRIMFNTAFIKSNDGFINATKMELSPEDIRKDKNSILPQDFSITIFFDDFCTTCNSERTPILELCDACKQQLGEAEINDWLRTTEILHAHDFPDRITCQKILKPISDELEAAHLAKPLQYNPEMYRYWSEEEVKKSLEGRSSKWVREKRKSFSGRKESYEPSSAFTPAFNLPSQGSEIQGGSSQQSENPYEETKEPPKKNSGGRKYNSESD